MREAGYPPHPYTSSRISSNGKVVYAYTPDSTSPLLDRAYVAITGWEPTATAKVKAIDNKSKLRVDVNPNKG